MLIILNVFFFFKFTSKHLTILATSQNMGDTLLLMTLMCFFFFTQQMFRTFHGLSYFVQHIEMMFTCRAGVEAGDLITLVNDWKVRDWDADSFSVDADGEGFF